jgi:hypothetical protein
MIKNVTFLLLKDLKMIKAVDFLSKNANFLLLNGLPMIKKADFLLKKSPLIVKFILFLIKNMLLTTLH